jgi:hypothetical protein
MATAAQDVFTEHLGVISALRDNYARTEDATAVACLVRAQQEVAAACGQREDQVKETIKGAWCREGLARLGQAPHRRLAATAAVATTQQPALRCLLAITTALLAALLSHPAELTGRVHKAERGATYPEAEGAYEARVAELAGASHAAQENVDALNTQLQALQQQREGVKAQVAALQQKADHIEEIVTEAEPRTRCVVKEGGDGRW